MLDVASPLNVTPDGAEIDQELVTSFDVGGFVIEISTVTVSPPLAVTELGEPDT